MYYSMQELFTTSSTKPSTELFRICFQGFHTTQENNESTACADTSVEALNLYTTCLAYSSLLALLVL